MRHVERWRDRTGKVRLYFRIGKGPRTPLRGPEGSPAFWEDYHAACRKAGLQTSIKGGSLRWLVEQYYKSAAYKQLAPKTRTARRLLLDRLCMEHGDKPFRMIETRHLRRFRDDMSETPDQANALIKVLRQVFKVAVQYGHVEWSPAEGVERLRSKNPHGHHAWTLGEIEVYEAKYPVGTKARLALALLLYTGQRRGDVIKMGRQHVRDGWMTLRQGKGGRELQIPILQALQAIIDASDTGDLTYLVTQHGKPYSPDGFSHAMRRWCDEAGLPQCSAHGLRKAAGYRMAEIGCTTHEIAAILGHETLKEVERYTKAANQKRNAGRARDRLENKDAQTQG